MAYTVMSATPYFVAADALFMPHSMSDNLLLRFKSQCLSLLDQGRPDAVVADMRARDHCATGVKWSNNRLFAFATVCTTLHERHRVPTPPEPWFSGGATAAPPWLQRLLVLHYPPLFLLRIFLALLCSYHLCISPWATRKGGWRKHQYPLLFFCPGLVLFLVRLLASPALRRTCCPTALFAFFLSLQPHFVAAALSQPSNSSLAAPAISGPLWKTAL